MEPIELWHAIIDAEAEYLNKHGHPAHILKLSIQQAKELAKLGRADFYLADQVMGDGIRVFERRACSTSP